MLQYKEPIQNKYLRYIEQQVTSYKPKKVLDLGCGTGLVTNLLGIRNKSVEFTGIDFSYNSINFAKNFAEIHHLTNVNFQYENILTYSNQERYDIILCQGVLHHIKDIQQAKENIDLLLNDDGWIILGLYHPAGKVMKKIVTINYKSRLLYHDQENNPYETNWTSKKVEREFSKFEIIKKYPKTLIGLRSLINSRNGGLCMYTLRKKNLNDQLLMKKIKESFIWPYRKWQQHRRFKKRLKELQKRDPFIYK